MDSYRLRHEEKWETARHVLLLILSLRVLRLHVEHEPSMWDNLKGQFTNHLDSVNRALKEGELPALAPPKSGAIEDK